MKILKIGLILSCLFMAQLGYSAEDPRVKRLLQDGLRYYSEHQYVRALDLFKQVQSIEPDNATAAEYIKNTKQRILEWELQGGQAINEDPNVSWDSLLGDGPANAQTHNNAKDIIAARKSLVERMRNRSTNTDNIVQIKESKRGLDVTLYHDHLFLPGLQTLRDESLPILDNVAMIIRTGGDRSVTLRSSAHSTSTDPYMLYPDFALPASDPELPQTTNVADSFQDIEVTRALILFTYLAQKSLTPTVSDIR